jgi:hypothetical protein
MRKTPAGPSERLQVRLTPDATLATHHLAKLTRKTGMAIANDLLEGAIQYVLTPPGKTPITLPLDSMRSGGIGTLAARLASPQPASRSSKKKR